MDALRLAKVPDPASLMFHAESVAYGALSEAPEQGGQVQEQPTYCKLAQRSAGVSGEAIWYLTFRMAHQAQNRRPS